MKLKKTVRQMRRGINEKPKESLLILVFLSLAAIPVISMMVLLIRYSVNAPFWDQWEYVFLIDKFHVGTLNFHDLWMQHNEHRMIFPRLATLGLSELTNYNVRYEIMANFITATATFSLLILMIRKTFGKLSIGTAALISVTAWLLYSPIQWINLIWGFQLAFFMGVFFSVVTIWLTTKTESKSYDRLFYLALITGAISTYCVGNGLIIWLVGLVLLLLQRTEKKKVLIWLGTSLAVTLSYVYNFHRSSDSLSLLTVAKEPIAVIKYSFTYLGRNLAWTPIGTRYTGAILLALAIASLIVIYKKGYLNKALGWLGLVLYVLLTSLVAATSRLNFGIDHAMANSYTTMSVLFIIATVVLIAYAAKLLLKNIPKSRYQVALSAVFMLGALFGPMAVAYQHNYSIGLRKLEEQSRHMSKVERCIYSARSEKDDCLLSAYPSKQGAWQGIQILKQAHWGRFGNE